MAVGGSVYRPARIDLPNGNAIIRDPLVDGMVCRQRQIPPDQVSGEGGSRSIERMMANHGSLRSVNDLVTNSQ